MQTNKFQDSMEVVTEGEHVHGGSDQIFVLHHNHHNTKRRPE